MVLIVIDAQSGITNEKLYAFGKFKANVKALISAARQNNVAQIEEKSQRPFPKERPRMVELLECSFSIQKKGGKIRVVFSSEGK